MAKYTHTHTFKRDSCLKELRGIKSAALWRQNCLWAGPNASIHMGWHLYHWERRISTRLESANGNIKYDTLIWWWNNGQQPDMLSNWRFKHCTGNPNKLAKYIWICPSHGHQRNAIMKKPIPPQGRFNTSAEITNLNVNSQPLDEI
jgi:hypothetical protein